MSYVPASKLIPGVGAGFVAAYGLWTFMAMSGDKKLPHTVTNPDWKPATKEYLMALPRTAASEPVVMNPGRFM